MKKHFPLPIALISVVLSAELLTGLASCTLRKNNNMTGDPQISREYTPEERESLRDPGYSSSPFFDIAEGTDYPDEKEKNDHHTDVCIKSSNHMRKIYPAEYADRSRKTPAKEKAIDFTELCGIAHNGKQIVQQNINQSV